MSPPLRIAMLAGPFDPTPPHLAGLDLARALAARGHRVEVLAGDGPLLAPAEREGLARRGPELSGSLFVDLPKVRELGALLAQGPADLVHVLEETHARVGAAAARLAGCRTVIGVSRPDAPRLPRAAAFLVPGTGPRDRMVADLGFPADRVRVVPPALDLERRSAASTRPFTRGVPVAACVSDLRTGAGIDTLLAALGLLLGAGRDLHLLVLGTGPDDGRVRRIAREAGLARRATFAPPPTGLDRALDTADLLVHPAAREGFAASILLAMASGRPVVSTGVGTALSLVAEGTTGFLVPREEPAAMAERIAWLLDHPDDAAGMGRAGRRAAEERHGVARAAERVEEIYREALLGS